VTATLIVPVVDEGPGNSAYLADLGDGRALAVDVPRDLRAVRAAAGRHGLKIVFAADTHLHADFLSGAPQLAVGDGTRILAYLLLDGGQVLRVFTGGRCWLARLPAPTCPARSTPGRWPGHSTPP
jgi:glyoxylase-like metal-dependent hydrolase (beta-lactamase superfamily II)